MVFPISSLLISDLLPLSFYILINKLLFSNFGLSSLAIRNQSFVSGSYGKCCESIFVLGILIFECDSFLIIGLLYNNSFVNPWNEEIVVYPLLIDSYRAVRPMDQPPSSYIKIEDKQENGSWDQGQKRKIPFHYKIDLTVEPSQQGISYKI